MMVGVVDMEVCESGPPSPGGLWRGKAVEVSGEQCEVSGIRTFNVSLREHGRHGQRELWPGWVAHGTHGNQTSQ